MKIIYWSDYAGPYCYIGEVRLHKAVAELGMENMVEYEPRAFELDPRAPTEPLTDTPNLIAKKYNMTLAEVMDKIGQIETLGRAEGLNFKCATAFHTNTFNAHRLMKLALSTHDKELARKTNDLLFDAYFGLNLNLADCSVLLETGKKAGLDEKSIKDMLDSDLFELDVRTDEKDAATMGVRGVPYFILENGLKIPGCISLEDFKNALQSAVASNGGKAGQCGPNGCVLQ